ncbi:MAG: hypothetical protein ACJATT_006016, partial [Myxococcota bacterium]
MTRSAFLLVQLALSLSLTVGCSEDASLSFSNPAADTDLDTNQAPGAEAPDEDQDGDTAPPEREDGFAALLPAQTDVYVFIANPDRGTVTRIDVHTKEVLTTRVGNDPQIVLTTPDYATAAVFNRGDDTVTVLDAGSLVGVQVPVRPHMNRMVMSPDGGWALL